MDRDNPPAGRSGFFWTLSAEEALRIQESSLKGLSTSDVEKKRATYGHNTVKAKKKQTSLVIFLNQFKSPITLILLFAAALSFFLQDPTDAAIIIVIVLFSTLLGYWQEKTAGDAVARLMVLIQIKTKVLRDGKEGDISIEEVVPGDVVLLSAGNVVPADCLILEEDELFVDEAAFTGESFPVEKDIKALPADTVLSKRSNSLFMGAHIVSGTAKALVVATGENTEFGKISLSLHKKSPETDFERGIRKFGYLLMQVTLVMVILIFGLNVLLKKPVLESLLFTLAIAVGLTPQLLPAITTVTLSRGANKMAKRQVIVKRLNSIENFGNMSVLCSDKTGTLTDGAVKVNRAINVFGSDSNEVLLMAKINASLQQGFKNPIDEAVSTVDAGRDISGYERIDEIPYDFIRKRLSILTGFENGNRLVTKGAVSRILDICDRVLDAEGNIVPMDSIDGEISKMYESLSSQGFRTLGVAYKDLGDALSISKSDEANMVFAGFVSLFDPLKPGIRETIAELGEYGIELKVITGDNALIAKTMSVQAGMDDAVILTGDHMRKMSDAALIQQVSRVNVFAEVEPNQKERIINALKKSGRVVGYMGDGINDVSALHAADVGISVNTAVDVARESADLVLLNQDLNVLIEGMKEGRRTFGNTQKYIFMATSANFGNMFSMAGASLFLPFLPLLPKQILLMNLITDVPAMTISSDNVDDEWIKKPRKWDIGFIKRFMVVFGVLSSVFDYLTFGVLLFVLKASDSLFQTGWFIESVVSATLIVLVVRTRKSFFKSKPGRYLSIASVSVALIALVLPFLPFSSLLGFSNVPLVFYPAMLGIVVLYIASAEWMKKIFYRHFGKEG